MKTLFFVLLISCYSFAQVVLNADGPGYTYELITNKFAPGRDTSAVEDPQCIHPQFGRHIAEVWDDALGKFVFEFYSHRDIDNDRCMNFDRQRIEIKTYDSSPAHLKGTIGEWVTYKWRFKLPVGFKPSPNFTHIFQVKAVGGDDGDPLVTLTVRKGTPNKIELKHNNQAVVGLANLSDFEGQWVECASVIYVDSVNGKFSMSVKKVSDGTSLISYSSNKIMTIRKTNTFIRPKWGIYRSLLTIADLRDEAMRFSDFLIAEGTTSVNDNNNGEQPQAFEVYQNYPNPFNSSTMISFALPTPEFVKITLYNRLGEQVRTILNSAKEAGVHQVNIDAKELSSGIYLYKVEAGDFTSVKKLILLK